MSRGKVMASCGFTGCDRRATNRGLCAAHAWQRANGKTLTPIRAKRRVQWRGRLKLCPKCDEFKDMDDFGIARARPDGRAQRCLTCTAEYRAANRDSILRSWLKNLYGTTLEWYQEKLAEQGGVCEMCGNPPRDRGVKRLSVDHDHSCCPGTPACGNCNRGLLCRQCNSLLGYARDNARTLQSGIDYLNKYSNDPS